MKKLTNVLIALTASIGTVSAGVVPQNVAQKVAANFYEQSSPKAASTLTLTHTESDAAGLALYYVYNVNQADGWVIVSAEDAARPIIGYCDHGQYVTPAPHTNIDFWMNYRKNELIYIRANAKQIVPEVSTEWNKYAVANKNLKKPSSAGTYLCQSTWDQQYSPYPYNYFCPPNTKGSTANTQSVTGCVATAMSQIMRYWSYPAKGTGSHSYCDCTADQYTDNWGTLTANFAHTYNWSVMPLSPASTNKVSTADTDVARLMSDAGISVEMDYDPNGSGAYVLSADIGGSNSGAGMAPCAQYSYVTYFGYDAKTIHGINYPMNSDAQWVDSLKKEFTNKRIIEYEGQASDGGHTWVCDGNDATTPTNNIHMNWGWSGYDDGFFAVSNLDPDNSMPTFNQALAALIGIQPPPGSPTAVLNVTPETNVSVYPNPSNGTFTFELNNVQNKQLLGVFNMLGQNVYNTELNEGKTQVNFTQTPGIYFYRILSAEGNVTSTGKLIVK